MKNENMTKADLRVVLEGYRDVVKDKSLKDRIKYTLSKYGASTKRVVLDLIADIEASLTPAPLPVENSPKPSLKPKNGKKSAPAPKSKSKKVEEPEAEAEEEEKPAKKSAPKKSKDSKKTLKAPKSVKGPTEASAPMAAIFPKTLEDVVDGGKLVAVPNKYHSVEELVKAVTDNYDDDGNVTEEAKIVFIAAYFPIAAVKKYGYSYSSETDALVPKKGFKHDLDIQQVVIPCEKINRVYALSDYTDAIFYYDNTMLTPTETTDSATGDTVLTRFANGCEFELYEFIPEEDTEDAE